MQHTWCKFAFECWTRTELIATDLMEYKKLAISLSEDEDRFMDILRLLDDSRDESNLFNCQLWVDCFEAAIKTSVPNHRLDLKPDHIKPEGQGKR